MKWQRHWVINHSCQKGLLGQGTSSESRVPKLHLLTIVPTDVILLLVVYYEQQTGAPHTVRWSKLKFLAIKQVFLSFSVTNRKKEKKPQKITRKLHKKGSTSV